jgi:hypothetical protein
MKEIWIRSMVLTFGDYQMMMMKTGLSIGTTRVLGSLRMYLALLMMMVITSIGDVTKERKEIIKHSTPRKGQKGETMNVYSKARGYRKLKEGVSLESYQVKYNDAFCCDGKPDLEQLAEWEHDGISETPCGCIVEPDGECYHGVPSWLIILGLI